MLRVLPRQAAQIISDTFPWAMTLRGSEGVRVESLIGLGAVLSAIEGVPEEFPNIDGVVAIAHTEGGGDGNDLTLTVQ